jgi:hypothetical protein
MATGLTMTRKRAGRPKTSARSDVSIKFDKTLAGMARMIAQGRGVTLAAYLSETTRPAIERDYARLLRELEGGGPKR